ncbi:hypothetical protein E2C01_069418 [Portunus trituberculatus]|uniref:Uncharacterized protein n=1 Tax=Portunus trituberculatus TaxID=210409 RepID=A0A5B7HYU0_PORTR|nr:hypothetical protein [Portunus trituberculatus]
MKCVLSGVFVDVRNVSKQESCVLPRRKQRHATPHHATPRQDAAAREGSAARREAGRVVVRHAGDHCWPVLQPHLTPPSSALQLGGVKPRLQHSPHTTGAHHPEHRHAATPGTAGMFARHVTPTSVTDHYDSPRVTHTPLLPSPPLRRRAPCPS